MLDTSWDHVKCSDSNLTAATVAPVLLLVNVTLTRAPGPAMQSWRLQMSLEQQTASQVPCCDYMRQCKAQDSIQPYTEDVAFCTVEMRFASASGHYWTHPLEEIVQLCWISSLIP